MFRSTGEPMMFKAKPARKIVRPVLSSSKRCGLSIGRFWKPREDRQDGTAIVGFISCSTAPNCTGCLTRIPNSVEALRRYETVRLPRTSRIQATAAGNKTRFHLPDGPAQQERDTQMAGGSTDWSFESIVWIYGHDAGTIEAVRE